ncbi:glutathione S-transferase family protein [Sneathiella limimaris]|uniref:glutathione S-transferase family protein n=1 Tax=Sneathiella limimaris TaxID=1964213 RepID=UPI00146AFCAB|nr:glutathione S-transferase family protein [Sneathiella limimaris]
MSEKLVVNNFPPIFASQFSPFGLKLESWLRLAGISYRNEWSFRKLGPKGKLPFVATDGKVIGDSELIIQYLAARTGKDPDANLNLDARAEGLMIRRMVEEHFYFVILYSRWQDEAVWPAFSAEVFRSVPWPIRGLIRSKAQKSVLQSIFKQGLSRHEPSEIYGKARADLEALSIKLGSKPYFLGPEPTLTDTSVYGHLANILYQPVTGQLQQEIRKFDNLCDYCDRLKAIWWPKEEGAGGSEAKFIAPDQADVSQRRSA